jgi:hypothetical protein
METNKARFVGLLCSMSAILAFALTASAADWKTGQAAVSEVDTAAHTITLDDEVFRVPTSCQIRNGSGTRIALSELRVATRPGVRIVPTNDVDYVHYEAVEKWRGWEMVKITILDRMPE